MIRTFLILLALLCSGLTASSQDKGWHDLWWSAVPKNYSDRTGGKVIPAGWVCLYWKDEPIGLLEPTRGTWLTLHDGKSYSLAGTRDRMNPSKVDTKVPAIDEQDEPKHEDKEKPTKQAKKPEVIPSDGPMFGVDAARISPEHHFYKGGRLASRAEVMDAISKITGPSGVPSDAGATRITVIGDESSTKKVLDDLEKDASLAWLKGKVLVQAYSPDHWRIVDGGFVSKGTPTIYCQSADGTVLWRQDNYDGGAPKLAAALRDKVPGYDPAKDPGPKSNGSSGGNTFKVAWHHVAVVLAALFYFWSRKRGTQNGN